MCGVVEQADGAVFGESIREEGREEGSLKGALMDL